MTTLCFWSALIMPHHYIDMMSCRPCQWHRPQQLSHQSMSSICMYSFVPHLLPSLHKDYDPIEQAYRLDAVWEGIALWWLLKVIANWSGAMPACRSSTCSCLINIYLKSTHDHLNITIDGMSCNQTCTSWVLVAVLCTEMIYICGTQTHLAAPCSEIHICCGLVIHVGLPKSVTLCTL